MARKWEISRQTPLMKLSQSSMSLESNPFIGFMHVDDHLQQALPHSKLWILFDPLNTFTYVSREQRVLSTCDVTTMMSTLSSIPSCRSAPSASVYDDLLKSTNIHSKQPMDNERDKMARLTDYSIRVIHVVTIQHFETTQLICFTDLQREYIYF